MKSRDSPRTRRLVAASQPGFAPKLFHKAALEGDEDSSLAGDIRQALANKKQRVVGIVINAVDDHLDKGDQIDAVWTMQHIRVLEPILAEASAAGRLVILLSDHGHVLDRQTEYREATDGLRWRRPGGAVTKDELEVASPRVVMPDGGRVVVPWSERLRYGAKKNGYHGGATPQEMLIPISILVARTRRAGGFWRTAGRTSLVVDRAHGGPVRSLRLRSTRNVRRRRQQLTLFDLPRVPQATPVAEEPWIKALLQSEVFAVQKNDWPAACASMTRQCKRLLAALVSRGGSMTAAALAGAIESARASPARSSGRDAALAERRGLRHP